MDKSTSKYLIIVAGATATGKTGIALELAKYYGTSVLSADSRQVYRELNIGVAKPTIAELGEIEHFHVGHVSIHDDYSVGRFETEAIANIERIFCSKDVMICAGGSGLYLNALRYGIDHFPRVPSEIRAFYRDMLETQGINPLKRELQKRDPEYYNVVDIDNGARIIRALSVCKASGLKYSSFLSSHEKIRPFNCIPIILEMPRKELYEKINGRVDEMIKNGLVDEVEGLLPYRHLPALRTVGYRELIDYFDGNLRLDEAITLIKQKTRNYAKRQMTWFRGHGPWTYMQADDLAGIKRHIDSLIN